MNPTKSGGIVTTPSVIGLSNQYPKNVRRLPIGNITGRTGPRPLPQTESERKYLREIYSSMDSSYMVVHLRTKRTIPVEQFKLLYLDDKKDYEVVRANGTILSWENYDVDTYSTICPCD